MIGLAVGTYLASKKRMGWGGAFVSGLAVDVGIGVIAYLATKPYRDAVLEQYERGRLAEGMTALPPTVPPTVPPATASTSVAGNEITVTSSAPGTEASSLDPSAFYPAMSSAGMGTPMGFGVLGAIVSPISHRAYREMSYMDLHLRGLGGTRPCHGC